MTGSLYLFPADHLAPTPPTALVLEALRDLDLLGEPWSATSFAVGPNFHQHVVFAGCSPHLVFAPARPGDVNFCHVALLGPYDKVRLITGPHTQRPRCPKCGERALSWQALQAAWQAGGQTARFTCSRCRQDSLILAWRWRRQAVFGPIFVAVRGVFPSEAVPSDSLLDTLSRATGMRWDYGWAATINS